MEIAPKNYYCLLTSSIFAGLSVVFRYMSPLVIMGLLGGLPLLLALFLRVHTSALFLSIASGYLLSSFVGDTAGIISRSFITTSSTAMVTKLLVFFLPIVITMWLMRGSLSPVQMPMHFLPMVGCALLVLVLGLPLLSQTVQNSVYSGYPGNLLKQMPDAIVAISVALQLVLMWVTARPRHAPPAHHGRHKQ